MAVLPITISEAGRQRLSVVLWVVHWMCAVCGLSIIGIGLYIKIRVQDKVNLVEGYDGTTLPLMLIIIGAITAVIDLAGGKLCLNVADISRRQRLKSLLPAYLVLFIVLNFCIFVAGCTCFAHRYHLQESFHRGLTKNMKNFKDNEVVKYEINQLQVDFECCGNDGYEDWFAVQWIGDDYLDKANNIIQSKMTAGRYLNDDAPYSCCRHNLLRPCIHHHVHDNDRHFHYDYNTGLTLHERGCKHALMDYFTARLNRVGAIILVIFVLQSVIFLLLRYLQTSIKNAYDQGDPEESARGWLLANTPFAKRPGVDEADECFSSASEESFRDDYQPEGHDWNEQEEPIYGNTPQGGQQRAEKNKKDKKSKTDKKSKSDKKSKADKKTKPGKESKSTQKSPGSAKKSPGSAKKSTGSAKKSPGSAKKSTGSAKKSPGSATKSTGSAKKSSGSAKKSPGSAKKSPGSAKKSPGSAKKSPRSTKSKSKPAKSTARGAKKTTGKKPRMKNKNNNIESDYSSSSESSGGSDCSQTPLLSPSSRGEELPCDRHSTAAPWWWTRAPTIRRPESTYVDISD